MPSRCTLHNPQAYKGHWPDVWSARGDIAEYSVAPAISTFKFEKASFEDIATLPLAVMTSFLCLFHHLGLKTPPEDGALAPSNGQVVIVNGASSSIGTFASQLARHAGYKVVGIAGQSEDVAKEFGSDEVVDYRGKDDAQLESEVAKAVEKLGGMLAGAYDGVSTTNTVIVLGRVLHKFGEGKIAAVLPTDVDKDPSMLPEAVKNIKTSVFDLYKNTPEMAAKWYRIIGRWVDEGKFRANNVRIVPGGLDGVKEGLDMLKGNKVNAVKLVYRIQDTGRRAQ